MMGWQGNTYTGRRGNAWAAAFLEPRDDTNFVASWVAEATWAHPCWDQYLVICGHLRNVDSLPLPYTARHEHTHELYVYALDPETISKPGLARFPRVLMPPNHRYHFTAANDAAAADRVQKVVERIADGEMNPDTDGRAQWNLVFADGASLLRHTTPIMQRGQPCPEK